MVNEWLWIMVNRVNELVNTYKYWGLFILAPVNKRILYVNVYAVLFIIFPCTVNFIYPMPMLYGYLFIYLVN